MIGKLDEQMQFHSAALQLRAKRQSVLAANIANADTPNYKARDLDFAQVMQSSIRGASQSQPLALSQTSAGHLPGSGLNAASAALSSELQYRLPTQPSIDGNTVDMDVERANFADNAMKYEASLRFLNGQIQSMQKAIQSQ